MEEYFWPVLVAWLWFFGGWITAGSPTNVRTILRKWRHHGHIPIVMLLWPVLAPAAMAYYFGRGVWVNIRRLLHRSASRA